MDPWHSWSGRIEKLAFQHPLRVLFWQTTLDCDSSCQYCSSPREWWVRASELTTKEICDSLESIAREFDLTELSQLSLTGGEPLLRPDLPLVVRHAHCLGFRCIALQTNGRLAVRRPDLVDELIEAGVTVWGVNLDGPPNVHNSMRLNGVWFEDAEALAHRLCADSRVTTTLTTLFNHENLPHFKDIFARIRLIKPAMWRIAHFDAIGRGAENAARFALSQKELQHLLEQIAIARATVLQSNECLQIEFACGGWLGKQWEGVVRPFVFHCVSGLDTMTILYDGGITGCPVVSRDLIQGNTRSDRIRDVWDNRFEFFRNLEKRRTGKCSSCGDWPLCHGGCMHNLARSEWNSPRPTCLRPSDEKEEVVENG